MRMECKLFRDDGVLLLHDTFAIHRDCLAEHQLTDLIIDKVYDTHGLSLYGIYTRWSKVHLDNLPDIQNASSD